MPQGYTSTPTANALVLQKVTPHTFCLMVLYPARPMTQPLAAEAATEWKAHVAGAPRPPRHRTELCSTLRRWLDSHAMRNGRRGFDADTLTFASS